MTQTPQQPQTTKSWTSTATKALTRTTAASCLLLTSQLLYVLATTPRLPPPPQSAQEFPPQGIRVHYWSSKDETNETFVNSKDLKDSSELCLVLLGDSPIEGIGNATHDEAVGGQTALALSRYHHRPVRYWAYGKSGLTAAGIEEEMLPLLKQISKSYTIDVIVVSCGVNNVLWGQGPKLFGREVERLLNGIVQVQSERFSKQGCGGGGKGRNASSYEVLFMSLLDFSVMPFLPRPLNHVLGWRSRALWNEMERVIFERQESLRKTPSCPRVTISIATIPPATELLEQGKDHPLLDAERIGDKELTIDDFFAEDGFHPAKHGTELVGALLARTYSGGSSTG